MVLFFTHIPFVVNHTINATPPDRLQQGKIDNALLNFGNAKRLSILPHEAKALLQLFYLQPIIFGWKQNSFSGTFATWSKIIIHYFTWPDQDCIGLIIFRNFADQDWIGFNFIGSGLDSDWKFSQSAHLWYGASCSEYFFMSVINPTLYSFRSRVILVINSTHPLVAHLRKRLFSSLSGPIRFPLIQEESFSLCCLFLSHSRLRAFLVVRNVWYPAIICKACIFQFRTERFYLFKS